MPLKVDLKGNRRLNENVILEVKAAARRLGLEIEVENVVVVRQTPNGAKAKKTPLARNPASGRKPRASA